MCIFKDYDLERRRVHKRIPSGDFMFTTNSDGERFYVKLKDETEMTREVNATLCQLIIFLPVIKQTSYFSKQCNNETCKCKIICEKSYVQLVPQFQKKQECQKYFKDFVKVYLLFGRLRILGREKNLVSFFQYPLRNCENKQKD